MSHSFHFYIKFKPLGKHPATMQRGDIYLCSQVERSMFSKIWEICIPLPFFALWTFAARLNFTFRSNCVFGCYLTFKRKYFKKISQGRVTEITSPLFLQLSKSLRWSSKSEGRSNVKNWYDRSVIIMDWTLSYSYIFLWFVLKQTDLGGVILSRKCCNSIGKNAEKKHTLEIGKMIP